MLPNPQSYAIWLIDDAGPVGQAIGVSQCQRWVRYS